MENNTTNGSPAETPASRFTIKKLADIDEMREYRDTARLMEVGTLVDGLQPIDAARLARAIVDLWGPRTCRTVTTKDGLKRVIRCEERPLIERKKATQKAPGTPRKRAAKKTAEPAVASV